MTMIEKITKDRAWKGCVLRQTEAGYELTHKSGATAFVLKEPGDMDSRKWKAWAWKRTCERRG